MIAQIARHGSGQPMHGRFGSRIGWKAATGFPPRVRSHVNNRATAGCDHPISHGLNSEKHMTQIIILPLIPILWGDIAPIMAVVAGSIVDQDLCWPKFFC